MLWPIVLLLVAPLGQTLRSETRSPREYRLRFYHTHSAERLDIVYRRGETYLPESLAKLDHYLRDSRTGDVHHFDPHLFDLLYDLTSSVGDDGGEIDVVCGYRTPGSNEFLRTRGPKTGVAVNSLHMRAEAIDIRLPGVATAKGAGCRVAPAARRCRLLSGFRFRPCGRGARTPLVVSLPPFTRDTDSPSREPAAGLRRVRRYRQRSGPAHLPARQP